MFIRIFGNAFLALFALDGALSLGIDGLLLAGSDPSWLAGPHRAVRLGFQLLLLPVALAVPLTPALPGRVLLPGVAFGAWRWLGAAPLPMLVDDPLRLSLAVGGVALALVAGAFATLRWATPRLGVPGRWSLPASDAPFVARRLWAYAAVCVLLGPLLLGAYGILGAASALHRFTGGFIAFDGEGIHVVERHYRRPALHGGERPDPEIRLIGMMHVGREGSYARLFDSFDGEGTLVLEEGVSDDHELLADRLPYDAVVEPLGLERQGRVSAHFHAAHDDDWPQVRRADLDVSAFSRETLAYLKGLDELTTAAKQGDWPRVRAIAARPAMQAVHVGSLVNDVITLRDEHLARELEAALPHYRRIVVPWGAAHQRHLSRVVESWGFEQVHAERHLVVEWGRLWRGLRRLSGAAPRG